MSNGSYIYFYSKGYESKKVLYNKNTQLTIMLNDLHVELDEISIAKSHNNLGNSRLTNIVNKDIKEVF